MIKETDIKYYLIDGLASANPDKQLKSRVRVAAIPNDFPFIPKDLVGHDSIRHLRKYDKTWKYLKSVSGKLADKICDEKFILYFNDFVLTPMSKEFNKYSFVLLNHAIHGDYDNDFQGLHLKSELNKDIIRIEETKSPDKNGVWEAKVYLLNEHRNKTYEKVSTFFPKSWTPSHFMFEIYHAIKNLEIISSVYEYQSITFSGIPVRVIIKENQAKTIFPIYTEE